jgi:hypothetical protein
MTQPPAFFLVLMTRVYGASPRLAAELWQTLCALHPGEAQTLSYALIQAASSLLTQDDTLQTARLMELGRLLEPRKLIEALQRLAPENGRPRRRDVRQLEGRLLEAMSATGAWR